MVRDDRINFVVYFEISISTWVIRWFYVLSQCTFWFGDLLCSETEHLRNSDKRSFIYLPTDNLFNKNPLGYRSDAFKGNLNDVEKKNT